MDILMRLGSHHFTVSGLNYQKLVTEYEARWKENFTTGGGHVDHFFGASPLAITISGAIFDEAFGGFAEGEAIAQTAMQGAPVPLYSRAGKTFGKVKILSVRLSQDTIGPGGMILEGAHDIKVSRYSGRDNPNPLMAKIGNGGIGNALNRLAQTLF